MSKYENGELVQNIGGGREINGFGGVILGVDGGATSTVCVCLPLFSDPASLPDPLPVLGRAVAGCSNHNSVGEAAARDTLEQVIDEALTKAGSTRDAVRAVCLAVSGVNHPKDQERVLTWIREMFTGHVKMHVYNDAVAALASGTMGKLHGCVLISGTGSISYGFRQDGQEARAGGGGPVLGDWGSGYGIAAQALTAVLRAQDGRGPKTMLTDSILRALGLSSSDELIGWTYADPAWARIAALVPVVVSCAEAGDETANKILMEAVEELAVCVKTVVRRLQLCGEGGTCNWSSLVGLVPLSERAIGRKRVYPVADFFSRINCIDGTGQKDVRTWTRWLFQLLHFNFFIHWVYLHNSKSDRYWSCVLSQGRASSVVQ